MGNSWPVAKAPLKARSEAIMVYICHTCKREVTPEGLKTLPGVKCPYCGGRILYKIRPPVVKRVKGV